MTRGKDCLVCCVYVVWSGPYLMGGRGELRYQTPRNAHKNFQHCFSIALQLQLSILLPYYKCCIFFSPKLISTEKAFAAEAATRTGLWELTTLRRPCSRLVSSPHFNEPSDFFQHTALGVVVVGSNSKAMSISGVCLLQRTGAEFMGWSVDSSAVRSRSSVVNTWR